ncbi:MAG: acyl-CoA dehydrogenase family protein [Burkholderiales bacterium]|nr:acyl-CoA dehydrogenase family protein [Burkholderiales bacterium]OUT79606.1 MAG: acyl-CoA dehydrogenase [Betaproteobacteria bacterium TMED22]|tara:strand:- start:28802 stop:29950 length:1149 start_codon:yes stop_codon:yes gene_type:complete
MTYEFQPAWLDEELTAYQQTVERFLDAEMVPNDESSRERGHVGHEIWRKAGKVGILCTDIPMEYGGGDGDFRHEAILHESMGHRGLTGMSPSVHSIVAHYFLNHGTEEQKRYYLPKLARGELVGAIAMSEPDAGSDLRGIRTRATLCDDKFKLNGSKTFITNGYLAEVVLVFARMDTPEDNGRFSVFIVEPKKHQGYSVGSRLKKIGLKAQDTSELFFQDINLSNKDILGGNSGQGLYQLMADLPYERLLIADMALGAMEGAYRTTVEYVRNRLVFGKPLIEKQNTRFILAEMVTTIKVARAFIDDCIKKILSGNLDTETASAAKLWMAQQQNLLIDNCVQLHGGYGFMDEYLVGRMFSDARVQRIYGGTDEIMKEIISRKL